MSKIRWVGYLLATLLALTALCAFIWKPAPPAKFNGLSGSQLPLQIGSFSGVDTPVDAMTKAAIPSADIIQRSYTSSDGTSIQVTVIGGTGRDQLHDPRSCLVGAGWQIQNDHVEELPGLAVPVRSCQVLNSGTGGASPAAEDLIYLYVVDQKPIASASTIRWTLLKSDLLEQTDQPVYFVRALTDLPPDSSGADAKQAEHARLTQFTTSLWRLLAPVIDRGERS